MDNRQLDPHGHINSQPVSVRRSRNGKTIVVVSAIVALVALCAAGGILLWFFLQQKAAVPSLHPAHDGNVQVSASERDISSVVTKVSPSVVSILTTAEGESYYGSRSVDGAGTGMVVSKDGYILTNKHVVSNTTELVVVTSDGTQYDRVRIVGTDPLNDVAVLKISGIDNLTPIEIGDSRTTRVGQTVIAIGNSLGQYQTTVTSGIISGKGRPISAESGGEVETLTDLLQTDAAINPGNSGGPLVNTAGQVVGINTAIANDAEGIGFSIPINAVKGILKGVLADGSFQRSYLGVGFVMVTPDVAKRYDLDVTAGAYVYQDSDDEPVVRGGPGDKAGIRAKDVIVKVNDIELGDNAGLGTVVSEFAPGEVVTVTYVRGGMAATVDVTLAAYRADATERF